jgi:hypothetical protein
MRERLSSRRGGLPLDGRLLVRVQRHSPFWFAEPLRAGVTGN